MKETGQPIAKSAWFQRHQNT